MLKRINSTGLLVAVLAGSLLLTACGGGSSNKKPATASGPVLVTDENIASLIKLEGAEQVSLNLEELSSTQRDAVNNIASANNIPVTTNSSFKLRLYTNAPQGKKVAGYVIEMPDGSQHFVHANQEDGITTQALAFVQEEQVAQEKVRKALNKKQVATDERTIQSETAPRVGEAVIKINGWSNSEGTLEQDLKNLAIRILPLFVNATVENVKGMTFNQITAADGFEMSLEQEVQLVVEAVATSVIQFTLMWDTKTDIDLHIFEAGQAVNSGKRIYYGNKVSNQSLGWLDRDNVEQYGPENITFNYKMPEGEYLVAVNYYSGNQETEYSVTVVIDGQEPQIITGKFNAEARNFDNFSDEAVSDNQDPAKGSHIVYRLNVDANLNAKLAEPIPLSQYQGVWSRPEGASGYGCVSVNESNISGISAYVYDFDYFPTGFRVRDGQLQASDAMLGDGMDGYNYAYRTLTPAADSTDCDNYDGGEGGEPQ
ncbi:MAG: hypothetical protein WAO12_07790 [Venatoribacter sp.]